jgi:hypothetical protein
MKSSESVRGTSQANIAFLERIYGYEDKGAKNQERYAHMSHGDVIDTMLIGFSPFETYCIANAIRELWGWLGNTSSDRLWDCIRYLGYIDNKPTMSQLLVANLNYSPNSGDSLELMPLSELDIQVRFSTLPGERATLRWTDNRTELDSIPVLDRYEEALVVYPVAFTQTNDGKYRWVHIVCPYCHRLHSHGVNDKDRCGFRFSHCGDLGGQSYYVGERLDKVCKDSQACHRIFEADEERDKLRCVGVRTETKVKEAL